MKILWILSFETMIKSIEEIDSIEFHFDFSMYIGI